MQECKSGSSESERWRPALTGWCTCVLCLSVVVPGLEEGGSLMMFPAPLLRRWVSPRDALGGTALEQMS